MRSVFAAILIFTVTGAFQNFELAAQGIKIQATIDAPHTPVGFAGSSPRYVLLKKGVADLQSKGVESLPEVSAVKGIPQAPERVRGRENIQKAINADQYWSIRGDYQFVDVAERRAGLLLEKRGERKTVSGNPQCPDGSASRYVEQYARYLCEKTRKYIDTDDYQERFKEYYFALIDLDAKSVVWMTRLEDFTLGVKPIGVHTDGGQFYFSNIIYVSRDAGKSEGKIHIRGLDLTNGKIATSKDFDIPVRTYSSYSIDVFMAADGSKIGFVEYDEPVNRKTGAGSIQNPPAQTYVYDVASQKLQTFQSDVTSYGRAFSRDGRYLYLASNAMARLTAYDLESGQKIKTVPSPRNSFFAVVSPNDKWIYVFGKTEVRIYDRASLKLAKKIPLGGIFKGVQSLLVSEEMQAAPDGSVVLFPLLEKAKNGPWWSKKDDGGFYVLELVE